MSDLGRRAVRTAAALGVAVICSATGAFTKQALTPSQQALASHYTNNDPQWAVLRKTQVAEDRAKGLLTARFPAEVEALSGKPFRISGFMTPLETTGRTRHFIVTRRSTTCPFCAPNEPTEAVEVQLDTPTPFTEEEVIVTGRMTLVAASDEGLFYRLTAAALVPHPSS